MLTADTAVKGLSFGLAEFDSHVHELADACGVELCKRIELVNLVLVVAGQELSCVVTAEAERHLRQVVGAEAEECSLFGDIVGGKSRSRNLDHGADLVLKLDARSGNNLVGGLDNRLFDKRELFYFAGKRNHNLGNDLPRRMTQ